ncbi:MAG: glutamate synthase large subunit [Bacteroidota bacterium]|jgi:glutamate synthase (NADPH/NADH) large chain
MQHKYKGLYVPQAESDSCGTGLVAKLNGERSHQLVEDALSMLRNMEHRGACGCEPNTGDGAGILVQVPHQLFAEEVQKLGFSLPGAGNYGVGMLFLPKDQATKTRCLQALQDCLSWLNFRLIGMRPVPVDNSGLGESALSTEPDMVQVFIRHTDGLAGMELERKLFLLRNYATREVHRKLIPQEQDLFYFASLSHKTIVYKGQLTTWQLQDYFPDLHDPRLVSAIALVHSRFSTNTFPKWKLAQPFRYVAHNGEINTLTGNLNWWKSRESNLQPSEFYSAEELAMLKPLCPKGQSDSGYFDNVLEMMVMGGRSLPHSMMMMIPEAWESDEQMEDYKKSFYEYHENLMEPWDGPAAICFTNGILVGATLDRNGLRPARYCITEDNRLILASEAGALPVDPSQIIVNGRLQPGRMLIADLDEQRIIADEEVKKIICKRLPYRDWLERYRLRMDDLPAGEPEPAQFPAPELLQRQQLAGYSREDLRVILEPMARNGEEPIGSMGTDTPLAVLSEKPQHLSNYFKQLFAQVTNPPIDPIRERSVMSLSSRLGGGGNFLAMTLEHARFIRLEQPVLDSSDFSKIKNIWHPHYRAAVINIQFLADGKPGRLRHALDQLGQQAEGLVKDGANILILSDQERQLNMAPIPSLLATGYVHHHLIRMGLRGRTSLVVKAGDALETHHFATLIGFGANAVYPYLALATVAAMQQGPVVTAGNGYPANPEYFQQKYIKAVSKGLLKIMSKNGVSALQSYHGSQIFEILGLSAEVVDRCFTGAISRIEGLTFDDIAAEVLERHDRAAVANAAGSGFTALEAGGVYQWKQDGEFHLFNPQSIHLLQYATRKNDFQSYKKYAALINRESEAACTLRGLLQFRGRPADMAIPLEEVEPVENILKRFATGAMSFGSISHEAHATLAIAMNRIGAKSNSGEGGEDPIRFERKPNGDWERSAIKQVASGRFGVTSYYLSNAEELQIKMAQGAKPGEGGQLPGHKVDEWIARVRHSTPGVGLISPPPHHDIYSIEDLAQLIFDLKNANRQARISVKLVSKAGVGVIASGVAKAHADAILISGHDGGTGASPLTSIRHAGLPWELGLAEAHQTLVRNKLRDRVTLQSDGQIRTGKDLAVAAILGAEEWGVATAALVVEGCILMRKCHLNTCPVGIATQDPELRRRFDADPQHIINFFTFLAEDLREIMASLGIRTVNDLIGRTDLLETKPLTRHPKHRNLDLSPLLYREAGSESVGQYKAVEQDHGISGQLDWRLLQTARNTLQNQRFVESVFDIKNTDRAIGTLLSNEITKIYKGEGLPPGSIQYRFRGSAGQSFGAFGARGIHFVLEGEANDYLGKGLSGGRLVVTPDRDARFEPSENIIVGNVAMYGATSGEVFINGRAGERFAVRNSGASAVVEGVGDHGCEYMTGGVVVVLGSTGKNFAAGMSGGMAFVYNYDLSFARNCNREMVDIDPISASDAELLRNLVRDHFRYTGSRLALTILQNWRAHQHYFVKVMPQDYKRVLAEREKVAMAAEGGFRGIRPACGRPNTLSGGQSAPADPDCRVI